MKEEKHEEIIKGYQKYLQILSEKIDNQAQDYWKEDAMEQIPMREVYEEVKVWNKSQCSQADC